MDLMYFTLLTLSPALGFCSSYVTNLSENHSLHTPSRSLSARPKWPVYGGRAETREMDLLAWEQLADNRVIIS